MPLTRRTSLPFLACVLAMACAGRAIAQPARAAAHPLDPLNAEEITMAARVVREAPQFPPGAKFATLVLKEPAKSEVSGFTPGRAFDRHAFAIILDRSGNRTYEAVVDVRAARLESWVQVRGVQPRTLDAEHELLARIVRSDPDWQQAIRKRGIENVDQVQIDGLAAGEIPPRLQGRRLLRAVSYLKGEATSFYSRPIEGIVALVDMNAEKVVDVTDTGVRPLPPPDRDLDLHPSGVRDAPRPLVITQPNGATFSIAGHEIRWQKWRVRFTMHPREGLVLHTIGYEDEGRLRSILYRASLSEMAVPYGDTDRNWRWRSAFDVGESGIGRLATSIEPDTDAPANAVLLDAICAGDEGEPVVLKNAVGVYERDGGMLWKHYSLQDRTNQSRRARELVIFFIATIGNYDYAISWIFRQDGVIEVDAALTGMLLSKGVDDAKEARGGGQLVAAALAAPPHQHFFNFRLDFDVDGTRNSVVETNTNAAPRAPGNPSLNGMVVQDTVLSTELIAQRRLNLSTSRTWAVVNRSATTGVAPQTSYMIVPGSNVIPFAGGASPARRRAGFVNSHFWATRYNPGELYAAGTYPNQSPGGDGLPKWAADNQSITNQDVVVWYTMGITHIPRPEEWPVMPVSHVGFRMVPAGFFTRNPALDVPK